MKRFLSLPLFICMAHLLNAADSLQLFSPDHTIQVIIQLKNGIYYSASIDGKIVLQSSRIDLTLSNGKSMSDNLLLASRHASFVNQVIEAQVPVQRKFIPDQYNQLILQFKQPYNLTFRVYNDGIAYQIGTRFKDSIQIQNEAALFQFVPGSSAIAPIMQQREGEDKYHTSFEELYQHKSLDSISSSQMMFSPVLVSASHFKIGLTESDLEDYPGMFLQGNNNGSLQALFAPYPDAEKVTDADYAESIVTRRAAYIAHTRGTRNFPWRVLLISRQDKELPINDLVYRLASPSRINDASWIHPGKCTDEWIIDVNLFNVPFKTGINTASYKYYIDFAKRFGFDRIMMDAGWSDARDLFKINPNINMDSISSYAREKGIKISMWTLALTLNRQLDSALDQFNKWGVDFIMTDFIDRDDQKTVNFYKRIAEACAKHKLMIMYHGAFPPKGFNRTYPNNITREGVLGSEYNAWSDKPSPEHDLTLPFTRMLAGPFDYEPGILDNATKAQFKPIWGKVMSQGTRCHQLAMFVVYDNPLQIFSGNPSQGFLEPAFMELLGSIPTSCDTTLILDASVSNYIITARKKGTDWFIAGMTNWTSRSFDLPLNFLSAGKYAATLCSDGVNAERYPADYRLTSSTVQNGDNLQVKLAPGGGFLLRLVLDK